MICTIFFHFHERLKPNSVLDRLLLILNKNSGDRTTFHRNQTLLLLLFILQAALSQICIQYSGSICTDCARGYQLVSGGCVSTTNDNYTANPILIFQDVPGVQKVLYNVIPVVVTTSPNGRRNQTISSQNIVNEFQVKKVTSENTGNYYVVHTNKTSVKDFNELLANSSILKEISQGQNKSGNRSSEANSAIFANLTIANLANKTQNQTSTNASEQDGQSFNLTAIKKTNQQSKSVDYNFTLINRANSELPANFTLIKQAAAAADVSLTAIKQKKTEKTADLILTPVKQSSSNLTLTQVNQLKNAQETGANLAEINSSILQSNQSSQATISTSNSNNTDLLLQLQQINQRLTQVGQAGTPASYTQAKMNQPSIETPVSLTQVNPSQQPSQNGGAITIQLTQVGQQLTQINQQLAQAKLLPGQANQAPAENVTQTQEPTTSTIAVQRINPPKLILNISQFQLPSLPTPPQDQPQSNFEPNLTAAKRLVDINWVKATRYELYNLTFVSQALTQAKLRPSKSGSVGTVYTFKCTNSLILFVPLQTTSQATRLQLQYAKYTNALSLSISKQISSFTQADRSTLCLDPPFQNSIQYLNQKYQPLLQNLTIFAVYYQFCGFAKTFRIFFIDDSQLPRITIYQGEVVVDLFRMMPVEVFFSNYNSTILQS